MTRGPLLTIAALTLVLLTLPVREARAGGSCSTDGDSGSSSSSSSSDDSGSDSESEPACEEESSVLGMTRCSRYGSWDRGAWPRLRLVAGTSVHRRSVVSRQMSAMAVHPDASARVVVEGDPDAGHVLGATFDLQMTLAVARHAYVGVEASVGSLESRGFRSEDDSDMVTATRSSATAMSAALVGGVAAPIGKFTLRGELAAGVDSVGVSIVTRAGDCETTTTAFSSRLAVRPRVSLERWLTPWMTVGASLGSDLRERSETSFGVFIGGHLRAFDGGR